MRIEYLAAVGAALAISLAACGGGASDAAATDVPPLTAGPVTTAASATTAPPAVTTSIALSSTTTPPPVVTTTVAATTTSVTQDDGGVGAEPSDLKDVVRGTLLDAGWLAEPGIYISSALSMPILFDLKDPISYVEWFDDSITFGRQDVSLTQMDAVVLSSFVGIVPSTEIGIHPGDSSIIPDNTEDLPDDLGDWLALRRS